MELWLDAVLIAIFAFLIDRYIGDVPNRYHPLRWMGNLLDCIDRRIADRRSRWNVVIGFLSYVLVLLVFGGVALTITMALRYGLQIDREHYTVFYNIFGSNLMPDITVLERGNEP